MRKGVLLLAPIALAMVLVSGVAWAVTKTCGANADFCIGTNDRDTLIGSDERDKIYGLGADDTLRGKGGRDNLLGGEGDDTIEGGDGTDRIGGRTQGTDRINGGDGFDFIGDREGHNVLVGGNAPDFIYGHGRLQGGPGRDYITGSEVPDESASREITGGGGTDRIRSFGEVDDTIRVRDNERDVVSCGPGTDKVFYDKGIDSVNPLGCEERIGG